MQTNPADSGPYVGCLAFILPYVEQDAVFRQLQVNWNVRKVGGTLWLSNPANVAAARTCIPVYMCPSDDVEEVYQNPTGRLAASIFYQYGSIILRRRPYPVGTRRHPNWHFLRGRDRPDQLHGLWRRVWHASRSLGRPKTFAIQGDDAPRDQNRNEPRDIGGGF